MKILCPGGYTWKNKGDAALVLSMLTEIKRVFPNASIKLISDTPTLDTIKYNETVLPPIFGNTLETNSDNKYDSSIFNKIVNLFNRYIGWRLPKQLTILLSKLLNLIYRTLKPSELTKFYTFLIYSKIATWLLGEQCHLIFPKAKRSVASAFCEADVVIFVPGGYIIAPHPKHTHWLRHVGAIFLAHWLKKPVYLYACTIGPFHGRHNQWLAKAVLKCANGIVLRELSSEYTASLLVPNVARFLTMDVAFLLGNCPKERTNLLRNQWLLDAHHPIVGISVRDYQFPGHPEPEEQRLCYLDAVAVVAEHLVKKHNASVYFVPQVLADEINDLEVSKLIYDRILKHTNIQVIDADIDPIDLKGLYSCFDAFIGVRMHANIFALSGHVPTVAIAYEPKTAGIMETLKLDEYVLDIRKIDSNILIECVDRMMLNRESLHEHLIQVIPSAREMASKTANIIKEQLLSLDVKID